MTNGQVVEWHPKFDLESVPILGPPRRAAPTPRRRERAARRRPRRMSRNPRGNGSAMPGHWGRANLDSGDVARAIAARGVTDEEAAAAALGDAGELPSAAVAAVMKEAAADHGSRRSRNVGRRLGYPSVVLRHDAFAVRDVQEEGVDLRGSAPTRPPHHHAESPRVYGGGGGVSSHRRHRPIAADGAETAAGGAPETRDADGVTPAQQPRDGGRL